MPGTGRRAAGGGGWMDGWMDDMVYIYINGIGMVLLIYIYMYIYIWHIYVNI